LSYFLQGSRGVWTKECEDALNNQLNLELYASYMYLAMVRF